MSDESRMQEKIAHIGIDFAKGKDVSVIQFFSPEHRKPFWFDMDELHRKQQLQYEVVRHGGATIGKSDFNRLLLGKWKKTRMPRKLKKRLKYDQTANSR